MSRAHTTFDVDDDVLAAVKRLALEEQRSQSSMLRILLKEGLRARKKSPTLNGGAHEVASTP